MAVICDSQGWEDIEEFAIIQKDWLKAFLRLPNGIPSHDTFRRVISRLNPDELQSCFSKWIKSVCMAFDTDVIAIEKLGQEIASGLFVWVKTLFKRLIFNDLILI